MVTKVVPNESPWKRTVLELSVFSQLLYQKAEKNQVIGFQIRFSSIIQPFCSGPNSSSSMSTRVHWDPQKAKGALCKVGGTPSFLHFCAELSKTNFINKIFSHPNFWPCPFNYIRFDAHIPILGHLSWKMKNWEPKEKCHRLLYSIPGGQTLTPHKSPLGSSKEVPPTLFGYP